MTTAEFDPAQVAEVIGKADIVTPMTIRAAVRVGLFDALADTAGSADTAGTLDLDRLTTAVGGHRRAVRVAADHLVHEGLLAGGEEGYSLTALGSLLTRDRSSLGLRDLLDVDTVVGRNEIALVDFDHTLRTGRPASEARSGATLWQELDDADADADVSSFDWEDPGFAAELILDSPVFATASSVLDLGGNTGSLALALLRRWPHLHASVLDFPVFTDRARARAAEAGLAERLTATPGSFFDPLPTGHDVTLLSAILADWDDDDAVAILRRAAEASDRVVVAEVHLTARGRLASETSVAVRLEASMTRPDRTSADVEALLVRAGLAVETAVTDTPDRSLFVARPLGGAA